MPQLPNAKWLPLFFVGEGVLIPLGLGVSLPPGFQRLAYVAFLGGVLWFQFYRRRLAEQERTRVGS